ncbi:MAG: hypothetical protein NW220_23400 [Leptolyngbyaceae cyanobacterium bins.349]|nr:hypothetical protein [Leptolyngbyaceae cyanobacterium bins.349]
MEENPSSSHATTATSPELLDQREIGRSDLVKSDLVKSDLVKLDAILHSTKHPAKLVLPGAAYAGDARSIEHKPVPASDTFAKEISKEAYLIIQPSQQAADLYAPADSGLLSGRSPQQWLQETQWVVATTQLSLLEAPSASPFKQVAVAETRSPSMTPSSAPFMIAADPANPTLPPVFSCPDPDPELGCLRVVNPIFPTPPPPILYLIPRVDFFRSNNLLLGIDPINDNLVRATLTLLAVPPLGPDTYILAAVDGAFSRYFKVPEFNYDELRIRAGILQRLSPTMTAEVGWGNQQLFIANDEIFGFPRGTRFLNEQAIRIDLSRRDQLSDRLFLNSIYQFRVGFAQPEERSRILNVLFLSLNYDLNPNRTVQLGLDYQFSAANYTVVRRTDIYHQLLGRVTLTAFRNVLLSAYGGFSFGGSTEPGVDFNSYVLGLSVSVNIVLF